MNAISILLTVAAMSVPQFGMPELRFLASHPDARLDRENLWSASVVELLIAPDGRVADCRVLKSAGDRVHAENTCKHLLKYRFGIPRGPDGEPSYGLLTESLSAFSDKLSPQRNELTQDFSREARKENLPQRVKLPSDVFLKNAAFGPVQGGSGRDQPVMVQGGLPSVHVQIDFEGKLAACEGAAGVAPEMSRIACEHAAMMPFAIKSVKGKPVKYVQSLIVLPDF
jgi:hypothetical protein